MIMRTGEVMVTGSILELLSVRRGHFALESGLHGDAWFDLEPLFLEPARLAPFLADLAELLTPWRLDGVCGAMSGGAFVAFAVASVLGIDFLYSERLVVPGRSRASAVDYRVPRALRPAAQGRRLAVVDDAINAGSAVTKTCDDLRSAGAAPVVMASLLTVGGTAPKKLEGYPEVVALQHMESNLWQPVECPLCRSDEPLADPYGA